MCVCVCVCVCVYFLTFCFDMIDSQEIVKKYAGKVSCTLYSVFPSVDCLSKYNSISKLGS